MVDGLVSIIMPSWNTGKFIADSIQSVIDQTYQNWELIIVDDCSTDNTDKVVASFKDDRIKYLKNDKNSGAALTRNRALREAKGEWIAFLDSDDLWMPKKLQHQINFMNKNGYKLSYTEYEKIDEKSKPLNIYVSGPRKVNKHKMYNYDYIGQLTMMYSAKHFGLIQIKDIKKNNDYAIRLQLYKKTGTCAYLLKENLAKYRVRKVSISHDKFRRKFKSHYDLFHMCDGKPAVVAMWYTCWNMFYGILKKKNYEKNINFEKEVCVIGHFAFGRELLNGQTIKTKIITEELEKRLGKNRVLKIDTHGGKSTIIQQSIQIGNAMKNCKHVIMMPAHNGVQFFSPLLVILKKMYHTKIHYIVIGGWLPGLIKKKKRLCSCLKKFDGIYVETSTMKKLLEKTGFHNVYIMPNCKKLNILKKEELKYNFSEPLKLCTFSRVMKEKGIEDAINVVSNVNRKKGRIVYLLDIYGQIEEDYKEKFAELEKSFPNFIHYCGCVSFNNTTEVLKSYYALLFPTRFYTEGIPGTVIDAYAAGVPVIASRWESFNDLIEEKKVGYGYEFKNIAQFEEILCFLMNNQNEVIQMKNECIKKAEDYTVSKSVINFLSWLGY